MENIKQSAESGNGDGMTTYKCSHCGQTTSSSQQSNAGCQVSSNGTHNFGSGYSCGNQGCGLSYYTNTPTAGCQSSSAKNGNHVWNAL